MMTDSAFIYDKAENLAKKCGTRNPLEIINALKINIFINEFDELLGMYTYQWKHRIMIFNSQLSERMLRMVAAHELGHDQLHRNLAKQNGFQEFSLDCRIGSMEYEANAFCAHLLMPNDEFLEAVYNGYSIDYIAGLMGVDENLVKIKARELYKMGYNLKNFEGYNSSFFASKKPSDI